MALRRNPHNAAPSAERSRHVKICVAIERHPLRPPQPAGKRLHVSALRDSVNAVVARGRRPGHKQLTVRMKRQVIRGDRRLQGGEYENFPAWTDLENRPAAVADV